MIAAILSHTPLWVFALLFGLIYLGYQQSKARTVSKKRLFILPVVMIVLSFSGVWSTFGSSALGIACWFGAVLLAVLLTKLLGPTKGVTYSAESQSFNLPGSWLPLWLMMAIFATKYAVGVSLTQDSQLRDVAAFIGVVSLAYGFWSGVFFGRIIQIYSVHGGKAVANSVTV